MKWLVGYTLASAVAAFIVVRLFDYIFSGARDSVSNAARAGLFVSIWTAVTTGSGMRDFTAKVRQARQTNKDLGRRIEKGRL